VLVHAANIQDNRGAVPLLGSLGRQFPKLRQIFADRVYRGQKLLDALADSVALNACAERKLAESDRSELSRYPPHEFL